MAIIEKNLPLTKLNIFSGKGIQMRTFHITWITFFLCFFGWFGLAPLMPVIRQDLGLTKGQIGNIIIAGVSATIFARLIIGKLCDILGPRKTYTGLLVIGAIPVMLVGLANDYTTFILFRLAISVIGASFVITQFHTSAMFDAKIKGTANAVAGGWGNLGGGITQLAMPLLMTSIVAMGYTKSEAWRLAMVVPGVLLLIMAYIYYKYTMDTPAGNFEDMKRENNGVVSSLSFLDAVKNYKVIALSLAYAACFGMEITFDGVAALYFFDTYQLSETQAGFWAMLFGFMNIFARALGGIFADKVGLRYGLNGKGILLAILLVFEGVGIYFFSKSGNLELAILSMISFALFLKMANGATYSIVPFVDPKGVGMISGIVGAGGNIGGMLMGFLFKAKDISYGQAFGYIGLSILIIGLLIFFIKFEKATDTSEEGSLSLKNI